MTEPDGDSFTLRADDALVETTGTQERDGDAGGTSAPAQDQDDRTQSYSTDRLSCTDHRTDLRTADRHASWREVARACHVRPGR
jgi:hypothetical protein